MVQNFRKNIPGIKLSGDETLKCPAGGNGPAGLPAPARAPATSDLVDEARRLLLAKQRAALASLDLSIRVLERAHRAGFGDDIVAVLADLRIARREIETFVLPSAPKTANLTEIGGRLQSHVQNLHQHARFSKVVSRLFQAPARSSPLPR